MKERASISVVVSDGLCTQCGWCVMACPHRAISQRETPAGYLYPVVDEARCNQCGFCQRICPGIHPEGGGVEGINDPFTGPILATYCGYATDTAVRERSQSGGIASALLVGRMRAGLTDAALVTRMPRDGSLRPRLMLAESPDDICTASGSKYCPVMAEARLAESLMDRQHVAVVGLPCQVCALRNLQKHSAKWRNSCDLAIGLICDRIMTFLAIEQILEKGGKDAGRTNYLEYRSKEWRGWPGDLMLESSDGVRRFLPASVRMKLKDVFTPPRCRICHDKLNTLSDISLGDAHGLRQDKRGYSVILARTEKGLNALLAAQVAGEIVLEPVSVVDVLRRQKIERKRAEWLAYCAAWKQLGWRQPEWSEFLVDKPSGFAARFPRKEFSMLTDAKSIGSQPTHGFALRKARRQLIRQSFREWMPWNRVNKLVNVSVRKLMMLLRGNNRLNSSR